MGKSTISMAIFHCYVSSPEGIPNYHQVLRNLSPRRGEPHGPAERSLWRQAWRGNGSLGWHRAWSESGTEGNQCGKAMESQSLTMGDGFYHSDSPSSGENGRNLGGVLLLGLPYYGKYIGTREIWLAWWWGYFKWDRTLARKHWQTSGYSMLKQISVRLQVSSAFAVDVLRPATGPDGQGLNGCFQPIPRG